MKKVVNCLRDWTVKEKIGNAIIFRNGGKIEQKRFANGRKNVVLTLPTGEKYRYPYSADDTCDFIGEYKDKKYVLMEEYKRVSYNSIYEELLMHIILTNLTCKESHELMHPSEYQTKEN